VLTSVLQPTHLIIVLAVALLVLGPKRLPDAGRALGQGIREFKGSLTGQQDNPEPSRLAESVGDDAASAPDKGAAS
jgi:sec-independent protein translocase protein TatA